jgi:hypothetical protein
MPKRTFVNEHGRPVEISAERVRKPDGPRVLVVIRGPDSVSTNEITPMEKDVLQAVLSQT